MADEKILQMEWPKLGIKVEAKPLSYNRKFFDALWQNLPFTTIAQHTLVTGEMMVNYCPANALEHTHLIEKSVGIDEEPVGCVNWGTLGSVSIKYGPCTEPLHTLPVAQIPEEYHDDLKKVGRLIWEANFDTKELVEVEFRQKK